MASPRTVLAHGCFDPFHVGHLLHFRAARKYGTRLVVAVTRDKHVNKGPGRPIFNQKQRAEVIKSLRCVDKVIFANDSLEALRKVKPAVFVKGVEYKGAIEVDDFAYCDRHGIRIAFTNEKTYSSTDLLRHYAVVR